MKMIHRTCIGLSHASLGFEESVAGSWTQGLKWSGYSKRSSIVSKSWRSGECFGRSTDRQSSIWNMPGTEHSF